MKIAITSDLHFEFRTRTGIELPDTLDADLIVVAGDTCPDPGLRDVVLKHISQKYNLPLIHPNGNHDFYGSDVAVAIADTGRVVEFGGKKIAVATLWSHLDPLDVARARRSLADFTQIRGLTGDIYNELHKRDLDFLTSHQDADIIVTHHAPSFRPVATSRFVGNALNNFFHTNLDAFIESLPNCKLWIFGHTHHRYDEMIGNTRVVNHSFGYPNETGYSNKVDFKIVEV